MKHPHGPVHDLSHGRHADPPSTASRLGLPPGLTDDDADRIVEAISNARTESTRTVYAGAWHRWECWYATRHRRVFAPATPKPARCADVTANFDSLPDDRRAPASYTALASSTEPA